MSFSLAHFPAEVLTLITAHLSDVEVTSALHICGNATLRYRLSQSTHTLCITASRLPPGRLAIISTFSSLLELIVPIPGSITPKMLQSLLQVLPSGLRRLSVTHTDTNDDSTRLALLGELSPSEAVDPFLAPFRTSTSRAIDLSQRFPNLELLSLVGVHIPHDCPGILIHFVCNLPRSLTSLDMPQLELIPINFWHIIPQHLILLKSRHTYVPRKQDGGFPSTLRASLRELNLNIAHASETRLKASTITPDRRLALLAQPALDFSDVLLPSGLTRLLLNGPCSVDTPIELPPTLTQLDWNGSYVSEPSLSFVMESVPLSVTKLSLRSWHLQQRRGSSNLASRPNLRELNLDTSDSDDVLEILAACPNLSRLNCQYRPTLQEAHINMLNPETLTSLKADVSSAVLCAPASPDSKPLSSEDVDATDSQFAQRFRHLRILELCEGYVSSPPFSFACIPPSVTVLTIGIITVATTLHLLPSSVTELTMRRSIKITNSLQPKHFRSLFFPENDNEEQELHNLHIKCHKFERRRPKSTISGFGSSSLPETSFWFPASSSGTISFSCGPDVTLPLPPTLTSFVVERDDFSINPSSFTQTALPSLLKLSIPSDFIPRNFNSLQTLHLGLLDSPGVASLPPHLTSLKVARSLDVRNFDHTISALPVSLTELHFLYLDALECLAPLINLRTLNLGQTPITSRQLKQLKEMPSLPPLTRLHAHYSDSSRCRSLLELFPLIRDLKISNLLFDDEALETLMSRLGPSGSLVGGHLSDLHDPGRLILSVGFPSGSITLTNGWTKFWEEALARHYPNWKPGRWFDVTTHFSSRSWSSFAPLLSHHLVEFNAPDNIELPKNFGSYLPRSLTKLRVMRISPQQLHCTRHMPPGLLELEINAKGFGAETYAQMPRTLRKLTLLNQKRFSHRFLEALPPQLTYLSLSAMNIPYYCLKRLEPSVIHLGLTTTMLSPQLLGILPRTIKQLEGSSSSVPQSILHDCMQERGMSWLHVTQNGNPSQLLLQERLEGLDTIIDGFLTKAERRSGSQRD